MGEDDDDEPGRRRARRMREQIDAELHGERAPRTPREFAERAAREAADEARRLEEAGGEEHDPEERSEQGA
jgi:hypothetical protein